MDTSGMTVFEFGEKKLAMGDIDPLYNALWKAEWPMERVSRYILAFVAFDLAGLAGQIVDRGAKGFWPAMHHAVDQTKRGSPRRYYRGQAAHDSLTALQTRYRTAEKALFSLEGDFADASAEVAAHWPGWGPTAAWKIADMAERCRGVYIDFSNFGWDQLLSNDMIVKGLDKAVAISKPRDGRAEMQHFLMRHDWKHQAPGIPGKPVGPQEIETILCYYSHDWKTNKHMPGMDKENIRAELTAIPSRHGHQLLEVL